MQTLHGAPAAAPRERGLGYALAGGLGITLLAVLLGAAYWLWFYTAQRGASPPELLPADTQLYITTTQSSFNDTPDLEQLATALRNEAGLQNPDLLAEAAERLSGVDYASNILTWMGSELAVSIRSVSADNIASADPAGSLLANAEIIFFFSSRNDPQAEAFLEKHLAAREARGERIVSRRQGEVTIYEQEGGEPSAISAFALIEHYVVFSNRADALLALASRSSGEGSLSKLPAFAAFHERLSPRTAAATFSDGSPEAEIARSALRQLLESMK